MHCEFFATNFSQCGSTEIAEDSYYAFAEEKFKDNNQQLPTEAFHVAYTQLHGHTWYVQMLLNRLYESNELVAKELVLDQNNIYEVYDRFFGIWLRNCKS